MDGSRGAQAVVSPPPHAPHPSLSLAGTGPSPWSQDLVTGTLQAWWQGTQSRLLLAAHPCSTHLSWLLSISPSPCRTGELLPALSHAPRPSPRPRRVPTASLPLAASATSAKSPLRLPALRHAAALPLQIEAQGVCWGTAGRGQPGTGDCRSSKIAAERAGGREQRPLGQQCEAWGSWQRDSG